MNLRDRNTSQGLPLWGEDELGKLWAASWEYLHSAYAKAKAQISFEVTAQLISAIAFAT